jgi:membrane protease YdiL (CAAX protease family)
MENSLHYYLNPIAKLIVFTLFIFLCLLPFGILTGNGIIAIDESTVIGKIIFEGFSLLAILGALMMMFQTFSSLNFTTVFVPINGFIKGFLKGSGIGILLILICTFLLYITGYITFTLGKITVSEFLLYLALFLLVAFFEELMFRTIPLYLFAERYPIVLAVIINSLLFSLVHFSNPNFSWLGMFNIALAGALFCIYTLQKLAVSWAIGIHFTWNFFQGIVFGFNVSGTSTSSVLQAKKIGNPYFSGGSFGIEGSIFCTIVLLSLIAYLWYNKPVKLVPTLIETEEEIIVS